MPASVPSDMELPERFSLDRMDRLNLGLTVGVGAILLLVVFSSASGTLGIAAAALAEAGDTPGALAAALVAGAIPLFVAAFIVAIVASVWLLFRPSWFELSPAGLRIRWPLRQTFIPLSRIERVERISAQERTDRYGFGARVGAGGMWGGFGYRTSNQGLMHMYISRLDYAVMLRVRGDKLWMITPRDPERFVATLRRLLEQPE